MDLNHTKESEPMESHDSVGERMHWTDKEHIMEFQDRGDAELDERCEACGVAIEDIDGFFCAACTAVLDEQFIAQCGLIEGQHFTRDAAGHIDAWINDITIFASWVLLMRQGVESPETLIPRIQALLEEEHPD